MVNFVCFNKHFNLIELDVWPRCWCFEKFGKTQSDSLDENVGQIISLVNILHPLTHRISGFVAWCDIKSFVHAISIIHRRRHQFHHHHDLIFPSYRCRCRFVVKQGVKQRPPSLHLAQYIFLQPFYYPLNIVKNLVQSAECKARHSLLTIMDDNRRVAAILSSES